MKNVIVTGGAGFIGFHLCGKLLELGTNVFIIDNFNDFYNPQIKRENVKELNSIALKNAINLNIFEGDIRDTAFLNNIFTSNEIDCIIHLAAYAGVRPSIENPGLYADVNITGTVNMLEIARNFKIKHFIFASSSSVYGNSKNASYSETDIVDFPISPYAATKKAGELMCYTFHNLFNINVACLRLFTVYGPGQRPDLAIHKFTKLILEDKEIPLFGDGWTERDYTYIDDTVQGIIRATEFIEKQDNIYEIFNLGNSKTINLKEMVNEIERCIGKQAKLKKLPPSMGDVNRTCADISKAKEMLRYSPKIDFTEGIRKFVIWYMSKFNTIIN
jgi:UDP-glucuronate 4-epimerase